MAIEITMPALSPTMEEGNLAKWLVKVGDSVTSGDVIAEIETDKATMEVEAVDEGIIAKLLIDAGTQGVKVNSVIALLAQEGEDASAIASAPAQKPTSPPVLEKIADAGAGAGDAPVAASSTSETPTHKGSRIFATPLARRIAADKGLDLAQLSGSGPRGRIVKADVEAAQASEAPKAALVTQTGANAPQAPTPVSDEATLALFKEGSFETVPHNMMRKIIAKRLVQAKSTIPHFYLTVECELDALLALRKQINDSAPKVDDKPAYKLSVNDMIIKAMAKALTAVPDANVTWTETAMLKHQSADVGVAVSIPGGLITPIIRDAQNKTLSAISNEMKDLAKRARERKLAPEEYQGGTTAISNLGMFGVKEFSAVINPPHATILAVGAGEQRPVVRNGEIVPATIMSATLSTDHRAVDGALGAQLLAAFRSAIEHPMSMLV